MNEQQLQRYLNKMFACIDGYRHKHYLHTINKSKFYRQLVTGEGQEELIVSYKERETEAQKEQRIKLTHKASKGVSHQVITQYNKVKRVKPSIKVMHEGEIQNATLINAASNFAGRTLQEYVFDKAKYYNTIDPNAWLILGYTGEVGENGTIEGEITTYPTEVISANIWDYKYSYSILNYLITGQWSDKMHKGKSTSVVNMLMYVPGYQISLTTYLEGMDHGGDSNAMIVEYNKQKYIVSIVETGAYKIPAMRFGYIQDYETETNTFVGFLDAASEDFRELINVNSEYSLTKALHTFLQKFQVAEPCDYMPDGEPHRRCNGGRLMTTHETCPSCSGKGIKVHTTTQDVMFVKRMSKEDENYIPLSEMIKYVDMPFEIVEHQHKLTKELPQRISVNLFGIDIHNRPTNATATEIRNFYDSLSDTLSPFAKCVSELYTFTVKCIADNNDIDNPVISHQYPQDFKLMSIDELLNELKNAKDAGASQDIIQAIELDIQEKQNQDTPERVILSQAKDKFRPYKNLSQQEILLQLTSAPSDDYFALAYIHHDTIFERIASKVNDFQLRPYAQQKSLVDAEIEVLREEVKSTQASDALREDLTFTDEDA
jgi:hypothetical protein